MLKFIKSCGKSYALIYNIVKRGIKMDEKITLNINNEISPSEAKDKKWLIFLICGAVGLVGGVGMALCSILLPREEKEALVFPNIPTMSNDAQTYSPLSGEALADPALANAPTYCIQTPNGTDGARPQAGLNEAGVIFEAIAEAGITRFAAIYQNPQSAAIGPIRSLRLYYLEWDTPFDCTIVHAGGADDALAAVRAGGYKDLTENYAYMYRGTRSARLWNNLFTTATDLRQFSADKGYNTSNVNGFSRLTPEEASRDRINRLVKEKLVITSPTTVNTSELVPQVSAINLRFGNVPAYNVSYAYDMTTNAYKRSYGNGKAHEIYACPTENLGERNPEDICILTQMEPKIVVAMIVSEKKASDNYHESITAVGTGTAYIFQNGVAIKGTWNKASRNDQIKFFDESGNEVKLAPGQTFVSAVPNYGGVEY